jgi:hypothetical protein
MPVNKPHGVSYQIRLLVTNTNQATCSTVVDIDELQSNQIDQELINILLPTGEQGSKHTHNYM